MMKNKSLFQEAMALLVSATFVISGAASGSTLIQDRIIGGSPADIKEFPSMCSIHFQVWKNFPEDMTEWTEFLMGGFPKPVSGWVHYCGATKINALTSVTAAHCCSGVRTETDGTPLLTYSVRIELRCKATNLESNDGLNVGVSKLIIHEKYTTVGDSPDICLLKHEVPILDVVVPNAKRSTAPPALGTACTVYGWGSTNRDPSVYAPSRALLKASLNIVACNPPFNDTGVNWVCAQDKDRNKGICSGDSGGPLVANGQLCGIASFVADCNGIAPVVYTDVSAYADWIADNTWDL